MNALANYKMGLVMSRAGMNGAQWAFIRRRLRDVARLGGADPDGIGVVVPLAVHHPGPAAETLTRALLGELLRIDYVRVRILGVGDVRKLPDELCHLDEVWCATCLTADQSEFPQRPARVHALAQKLHQAPRFKLLHYWVQPEPEPDPPKKKPPTLKGW